MLPKGRNTNILRNKSRNCNNTKRKNRKKTFKSNSRKRNLRKRQKLKKGGLLNSKS